MYIFIYTHTVYVYILCFRCLSPHMFPMTFQVVTGLDGDNTSWPPGDPNTENAGVHSE